MTDTGCLLVLTAQLRKRSPAASVASISHSTVGAPHSLGSVSGGSSHLSSLPCFWPGAAAASSVLVGKSQCSYWSEWVYYTNTLVSFAMKVRSSSAPGECSVLSVRRESAILLSAVPTLGSSRPCTDPPSFHLSLVRPAFPQSFDCVRKAPPPAPAVCSGRCATPVFISDDFFPQSEFSAYQESHWWGPRRGIQYTVFIPAEVLGHSSFHREVIPIVSPPLSRCRGALRGSSRTGPSGPIPVSSGTRMG